MAAHDSAGRASLPTVIAVAVVAYAAGDAVHELVGHGSVALLLSIKINAVSSVGLQSLTSSRLLSASGSLANVLAGVISFLTLSHPRKSASANYFLWLFGFVNLMNATSYLLVSALLNSGDWSVVIAGLNPGWAWRVGMGLSGTGLYVLSIRWAAARMGNIVAKGALDRRDLFRFTFPAYIAGGVLLTLASVFNPFSPSLILMSGAGASFGVTWGLFFIPEMVRERTQSLNASPQEFSLSWGWIALAAATGIVFVAVFGRGIQFS